MTVVIFGFEPFLEFKENPSEIVARSLRGRRICGHIVDSVILPVDYSKVEKPITKAIEKYNPTLALGIGLAGERNKITPEKVALNFKHSESPDNSGRRVQGKAIDRLSADGIFSNLPVEGLVSYLNGQGIPASLSLSAGSYLCNYAMFVIVRAARSKSENSRKLGGGFVHIPCHAEYVAKYNLKMPSLPLETMKRGVALAIKYCLENKRKY